MTYVPIVPQSPFHRLGENVVQRTKTMLTEFQSTYLRHPQIIDIETDLESILAFGPPEEGVERPARTYLLVGEAGAGKSTILKRFRNRHAVVSDDLHDRMEVVYAEVPAWPPGQAPCGRSWLLCRSKVSAAVRRRRI
ncbi:TniB family NTP-binding protein [Muricoccus vinaceus]|uniref:TniB family NTP-binding protein n=1 Tax=Muricoccus vinaceus TaxID=424704 RepID=A0ABV6IT65_9PROT